MFNKKVIGPGPTSWGGGRGGKIFFSSKWFKKYVCVFKSTLWHNKNFEKIFVVQKNLENFSKKKLRKFLKK